MDEAFRRKLFATFKIEAAEHIEAVAAGLRELRGAPGGAPPAEVIERLFREIHSMKGAARTVNMTHIEGVCRAMENIFAALKRQEIQPAPELLAVLQQALASLVRTLQDTGLEPEPAHVASLRDLAEALDETAGGRGPAAARETAPAGEGVSPAADVSSLTAGTIRIGKERLDRLLLQAEEMIAAKLVLGQHLADLRQLGSAVAAMKKGWDRLGRDRKAAARFFLTVEKESSAAASMRRLLQLLEEQAAAAAGLHHRLAEAAAAAERDRRSVAALVDNLLEDAKSASMQPFSALTGQMPGMVEELGRQEGKEVELRIRGAAIEIDRRILEELKDPFVHLLRNAVDHGIEPPAARREAGKPPAGRITIDVQPLAGKKIAVRVEDDGAGLDPERIRSGAVAGGLLTAEKAAALSPEEIPALIFRSGLSTSRIVTDISGRGLGLAILQDKVEKLGGAVSCQSTLGGGTRFLMTLPLSLATLRGVLVRIGEGLFVIPSLTLERVVRVRREEIRTVENRETISLAGQSLPLVPLRDVLELGPDPAPRGKSVRAVVLGSGRERIAFIVDEVRQEQEILIKDLGLQLQRVRNVAGSTILGSGQVVPVLNAADLMKSARRREWTPPAAAAVEEVRRKSILVVEDSITARSLLKSILEGAGYLVTTAVDGLDGLTAIRSGHFDLVVSDVDMPRMNGFELTARIRGDRRFAELPVILVTALESQEDRERGIDVGADAYIVKSSFDQSNLLGTIGRLL